LSILNSIISGVWAIDPQSAQGYIPFVQSLLTRQDVSNLLPQNQRSTVDSKIVSFEDLESESIENDTEVSSKIAVLSINGALTKEDGLCSPGMSSMNSKLKFLLKDDSIGGILLNIDSPGGEASFTPILANTIKNADKPIITYTSRMMASAAYWIGSSSVEVYASHKNDSIGSIGTMVTMADYTQFFEKAGVNIKDIYATASKNKNSLYNSFLDGDFETIQKEVLDPINEDFLQTVQSNRPDAKDEVLSGNIYFASKAVKNGLIDGIKSFDECISRLQELVSEDKTPNFQSPKTNNMSKKTQNVASFLGYEKLESKDGHVSLSEEDVAKLSEKVGSEASAQESDEDPKSNEKINAILSRIKGMEKSTTTLSTDLQSLSTRMEEVEEKVPGSSSSSTPSGEETETDPGAKSGVDPWDDPENPVNKATSEKINA